jgi:hypothetical protein
MHGDPKIQLTVINLYEYYCCAQRGGEFTSRLVKPGNAGPYDKGRVTRDVARGDEICFPERTAFRGKS